MSLQLISHPILQEGIGWDVVYIIGHCQKMNVLVKLGGELPQTFTDRVYEYIYFDIDI